MPRQPDVGRRRRFEPPARVEPAADAPPVYHQLARMPDGKVVAEFPFGDPAWELRYVYYSTVHWKRLVNGYSGGFPQATRCASRCCSVSRRILTKPGARCATPARRMWSCTRRRSLPGEAAVVKRWLADHFAVEIARFGGDLLFDVTGVWPPR